MKLLKISENVGQFLTASGDYSLIDKIDKDDLLWMVDRTLDENEVELDAYDDQSIKNQAHQVIYKSIFQKLTDLRKRRQEFIDESARLFLDDYERYRD
ncbi:hypothetical protein [Rhodoferax sp.]|uniref:hypothetical protein n=1 Tax=Rhodoferax sp. TaxID=50421 RepID=UPI00271D3CB6|nr:hypothetical protein [Rhodoferax sp.]MDO8319160.1 hypothetical protein [Rhodoferax sp.]MDP2680382.1 hypothetical protein [Rhodoferax sp.]